MLAGKITVGKRLFNAIFYLLGSLFQFHGTQFLHHRFCLLPCGLFALLSMDRLEHLGHQLHLGARDSREHIAVKVDDTALVFGLRKYFSHSFQHTKALVPNHQLDPVQATAAQPLKETDPAGLILFHSLGGTQNFTVSVLVYRNRHQYCHIFILSAPVPPQIDPVHIDVGIFAALQGPVPPFFDMDVGFLVQLTDGGW